MDLCGLRVSQVDASVLDLKSVRSVCHFERNVKPF